MDYNAVKSKVQRVESELATGSFDRHPLTSNYSTLEVDYAQTEYPYDSQQQLYKPSFMEKAHRQRHRLRAPLLAFGLAVVFLTARSSKLLGDTDSSLVPSPPFNLGTTCAASSVQTIQGAQACEQLCDPARCCHGACFFNDSNRNSCMQYHEHCVALDGVSSTGEEHALPKSYRGRGWWQDDNNNNNNNAKDPRSSRPTTSKSLEKRYRKHLFEDPHVQAAREAACAAHDTRTGLKDCIRLCIPASCCYQEADVVDACEARNGAQVDCPQYHRACNVLYGVYFEN